MEESVVDHHILNSKARRIKINREIIILSKLMDKNQIIGNLWNMKERLYEELVVWYWKDSMSKIGYH